MNKLADHIIAVAHDNDRIITNMQLQKVMFFTLGLHMRLAEDITQLALETYVVPFEKWKYGPTVESLYYRYNWFGAKNIQAPGQQSNEFKELNNVVLNLLDTDVFKLIRISHSFDSWKEHKEKIINNVYVEPYTIEEIFLDFNKSF